MKSLLTPAALAVCIGVGGCVGGAGNAEPSAADELDKKLTDIQNGLRANRPVTDEQAAEVRRLCDRLKVEASEDRRREDVEGLIELERSLDEARRLSSAPDGKADFTGALRAVARARSYVPVE
jgi:hypothetical protein